MVDITKAEEIVRIANNKLYIDGGIDYVAIIALIVSLLTFGLQWRDRKKDKKEQRKLREQDKQEQIERTKKEDAIRKWNALYPHRLEFYTSFYDYLFKLLNCNKNRSSSIICNELKDYCMKFNKLTEDSKVLFDDEICSSVRRVYDLLFNFLNNNDIPMAGQAKVVENLWKNKVNGFTYKFDCLLKEIENSKLDTDLRNKFIKVFKMEDNKDE